MHEGQPAKQQVTGKLGEEGEEWVKEGRRVLSEGAALPPMGWC